MVLGLAIDLMLQCTICDIPVYLEVPSQSQYKSLLTQHFPIISATSNDSENKGVVEAGKVGRVASSSAVQNNHEFSVSANLAIQHSHRYVTSSCLPTEQPLLYREEGTLTPQLVQSNPSRRLFQAL